MNIKKTILTFLILLVFGTTNAQSDATLEETIAWLNIYPERLISSDYYAIPEDFVYKIRFDCKLTDDNEVEFYWAENGGNNEYRHV